MADMHNDINSITQLLFQKENIDQVSKEELDDFLSRYPYAAPARFLLAKKEHDAFPDQVLDEIVTAGLYFHNPLWLELQLDNDNKEIAVEMNGNGSPEPSSVETGIRQAIESAAAQTQTKENEKTEEESPVLFQSYHTIDYFASQGIRLQQAELAKDKLGQQLKSFTEWLRSMKKLPAPEGKLPAGPEDDSRQQIVIQSAANSIAEKEVVTETMAEVWAKQGHNEKAIAIYQKLSLQNPGKSAYFAAKIDQLK